MKGSIPLSGCILLAVMAFSAFPARGQQALEWERKEVIDKELMTSKDMVSYRFNYRNTGTDTLRFNDAISSGFIKVSGLDSAVCPGDRGSISLSFYPDKSPVDFNEEVRLLADKAIFNTVIRLRITQCDNPGLPGALFRYTIGKIKFKTPRIDADVVFTGHKVSDTIYLFNPDSRPVRMGTQGLPEELEVRFEPETIPARSKGMMAVSFKSRNSTSPGYYYKAIQFTQNGKTVQYPSFYYSCYVKRDFSNLSRQELLDAPRTRMDKTHIDYGTIRKNEKITLVYTMENSGRNDLEIQDIRTTCGCTSVKMDKYVIKSGGSARIEIRFDSANREGMQHKSITIITNDPRTPETTLTFSVNVGG